MSSKRWRIVLVLLALTAVASLVVLGYATGRGSRLAVASVQVGDPVMGGDFSTMTGRLGASRSRDHVCFWIDRSGRQSEERIFLFFAEAYSADDALALLDTEGRLIAEPGEMVTTGNAAPRSDAAPEFCPSGTGMTVYDVRQDVCRGRLGSLHDGVRSTGTSHRSKCSSPAGAVLPFLRTSGAKPIDVRPSMPRCSTLKGAPTMDSSERDEARARLEQLKRSLDDESEREQIKHARLNRSLLLNTPPRALSLVGAAAGALIGAVVFALVALGTRNPWLLLPAGALALFAAGGFIASVEHSQG